VPTYPGSRLAKGISKRTTQGKKASDAEYKRRMEIRGLNEELSQYYQLATNQVTWACTELLLKGEHDHNYSA
jgi:hypothetical protein